MKQPDFTWNIKDLIQSTHGELTHGAGTGTFTSISTDSRSINPSDVFVALTGDNFDGHTFIPSVIQKGIRCIITEKSESIDTPDDSVNIIQVNNTLKALGQLAATRRQQTGVSVLAVTGSNGKTTTKEILATIFRKSFNTLFTKGNLNNEIGLPLTLLRLNGSHQWAITELGMNKKGEISRLSDICRPDIGVITNIGRAHIEYFGTIEGIADAKGELLEYLPEHGVAVLNIDCPMYSRLKEQTQSKTLSFGLSENADVRAVNIIHETFSSTFTICHKGNSVRTQIMQPGKFMIYNSLAAASAALAAGIDLNTINEGIRSFSTISGRMKIRTLNKGIVIIDDTYNASPDSMFEAVRMLSGIDTPGRKILACGDMLELGLQSKNLHHETGKKAAETGIDYVFSTGDHAQDFIQGAEDGGMSTDTLTAGSKETIITQLKQILKHDDILLIKGSRGMKMEEIIDPIINFLEKRQS